MRSHAVRFIGYGWVLVLCLLLQACATSPYSTERKAKSDALLEQQFASIKSANQDSEPARLFVIAVALHDQSKAFRGDVMGFSSKLAALHPRTVVIRLSNPVIGQDADLPYATRENLERSVSRVAAAMRQNDKAVVMLTTHGHTNLLAINAGGQAYTALTGQSLKQILKPLEPFDHGVVISACYSGSLIPTLQQTNRWILTAASAQRTSFGCQFNGTQTYYIQALLNQNLNAEMPLKQWYETAKKEVTDRAIREKLSPSSDPQWSLSKKYPENITLGQLLGM
jgi:hypothetical protein